MGGVETAAPPAPPARRSPTRWIIIGAIALVFVLIIGYVLAGAALASGPVSKADSALKSTLNHDQTYSQVFSQEPFKNVDFNTNTPDVAGAKSALAKVKQDIGKWQTDMAADRTALTQARADLQSSFLTLPEQSTITTHRHRVEAAISALATAQKGIDLFNKQLAFMDPFLDSAGGFIALGNAFSANDMNAIHTQLTATSASLQKAASLAPSASLPPDALKLVTLMQKIVTDMQAAVAAVEANDAAAEQRYSAAIDADGKAIDAIDTNAIDQAVQAVYKPLSDAYMRDMKTAAGD